MTGVEGFLSSAICHSRRRRAVVETPKILKVSRTVGSSLPNKADEAKNKMKKTEMNAIFTIRMN